MDHPYTIPIVPQDLAPAEALHQVFDSLKNLDHTISDVFTKISNRIKTNRESVSKITRRMANAQVKVKTLSKHQSKATTIYSAAKYPAPTVLPSFRRVAPLDPEQETDKAVSLPRSEYTLTKKQALQQPHSVDTSQLFTQLSNNHGAKVKESEETEASKEEGLGRLPAYLPSVSSLMLFNSDENPYKEYTSINNLEGVGGKDRVEGVDVLAQAPHSLSSDFSFLPIGDRSGFGYKPDMGPVPAFTISAKLGLPGVADISFGDSLDNKHIAPSATPLSSLPSLSSLPALPTFQSVRAPSAARRVQPPLAPSFVSTSAAPSASTSTITPPSSSSIPPLSVAPSAHSSVPIPLPTTLYPVPPVAAPDVVASSAPSTVSIPLPVTRYPAPPVESEIPTAPDMDEDVPDAPAMDEVPASGGASGGGSGGGFASVLSDLNSPQQLRLRPVAEATAARAEATAARASSIPPSTGPKSVMDALKDHLARRHAAMTGHYTIEREDKEETPSIPKLEGSERALPTGTKTAAVPRVVVASREADDQEQEEESGDWETA